MSGKANQLWPCKIVPKRTTTLLTNEEIYDQPAKYFLFPCDKYPDHLAVHHDEGCFSSSLIQFFFALMLKPIAAFFESKSHSRILGILASYLVFGLPLIALLFFFFNQSWILFQDLPPVKQKAREGLLNITEWLNRQFQIDPETTSGWVTEHTAALIDIPLSLLKETVQSGSTIIANTILVILITYFLLLYRTAIKNFLLAQSPDDKREKVENLCVQVQRLTNRYMMGQGLVILILGFLIGMGLWAIGVPYPFFWGYLAGFLEIIPYVGTSIGGLLPFTYMLMLPETSWEPWAVLALYITVQQIEGNLISPNVMGPSIKINPLFIIMGLFFGGISWGVSGMILALPILAVSKEVFRNFNKLAPFSYLMEDGLSKRSSVFHEKYDGEKHRLFNLFFKEKEDL